MDPGFIKEHFLELLADAFEEQSGALLVSGKKCECGAPIGGGVRRERCARCTFERIKKVSLESVRRREAGLTSRPYVRTQLKKGD